jgi:hypothetical protein
MAFHFVIHAMQLFDPVSFVRMGLIEVQYLFVAARRYRQGFARQNFDRWHTTAVQRSSRCRRFSVTVIVVFQVFENIADVQEGVSTKADCMPGKTRVTFPL